jgi:signal-transduction protein with cAMP-binding, CBS, and nucleotidyltransferase domain
MAEEPRTLGPDMTASDAAGLMANYDIGVVPIVEDDGTLAGLVTDRDLVVRVLARGSDPNAMPLREIATSKSVETISPDETLEEARQRMAEARVKRLMVTREGKLLGVVSLGDVAQSISSTRAVGDTVRDITESPSTTEVAANGPDEGTPERVLEERGDMDGGS